ncbi:LuxR C-terminal-related transcriptional regulator [Aquihabitans sp. G128]|uniref:helix-turn-helix transcriptional regulator n=1 Tax=Aquihabitans sp. G128 TaxID=2849779 RepID=UPI001C23E991|nr:LuxR family transcriptional regulator [Aquihabitans sp. G128]QXC61136.1 LuxR C-terminal-related transcriptional regulator [Aquihabitans sp. G128]
MALPPTDWPLTGREAELQLVLGALDQAPGVVLVGPAGVGKSRLAAEARATLARRDVPTHRVAASPTATAVPFAALSALVGSAPPHRAVEAVADALRGRATGGAVPVLHVDDAHLLDDASATAVQQLVASGRARVVLTVRTGEPVAGPIRSLWADGGLTVVAIEPLGPAEATALVAAALRGPVEGRTAHRLVTTSKGNVLFLRELVEGSLADGALQERGGIWVLRGRPARTPLVEDLIGARLGPLDADEREVAELLALSGPVSLDLLGRITDLAAAERLERAGLLQPVSGRAAVELAHPLYAEALLDQLPALTRLRLSRLLAEVADAVGPEAAGGELRVVLWRRDGGLDTPAERLLAAAQTAAEAGDTRLAAELALAAHDAGAPMQAVTLAASSMAEHGRSAEAYALVSRMVDAATDPDEVGPLTLRLVEEQWWALRDLEGALDRCAAAADLPAPWDDVLAAQAGIFAALEGRALDALEASLPLVDATDPMVARHAAIAAALGLLLTGRPTEGADVSARVVEATAGRLPTHASDIGVHVVTRAYCLAAEGDLAEATELAELVYAGAAAQPGVQAQAWAATTVGEVAMRRGDVDGATRAYAEGEQAWLDAGQSGMARWAAASLALAHALAGRTEDAARAVARAEACDGRGFTMQEARLSRARAWVAFLSGEDGPGAAAQAAASAAGTGLTTFAAEAGRDLLAMGAAAEAAAVLGGLQPVGSLARRWAELAEAVVAADAPALERLAAAFEAQGALLDAAEAAAHASRAHRAAGAARDASRCATRSAELAARCPGAATPILGDRTASAELSTREGEVARLAADGLSNRAIADRLFVSERTVENHLYRAFTKLGISGRDELGDRLTPR